MALSPAADCARSAMVCESFMAGTWEASADCAAPAEEKGTIDVVVESFDAPKFLWESFAMDEDRTGDMQAMQEKYEYDFSGYENEDGTTYNMMNYFGSTAGSGMEIVDGTMVLTANITVSDDEGGDGARRGMWDTVSAGARGTFPDLRTCDGLLFEVKATGERYDNFMVDFGYAKLPDRVFGFGYRAHLPVPRTEAVASTVRSASSFVSVTVPFRDFTLDWDWNTGAAVTSCAEDPQYCPDEAALQDLETITLSAMGATNGVVRLHVRSIQGTGCDAVAVESTVGDAKEEAMQDRWTCGSGSARAEEDEVVIESFTTPVLDWTTQNDPVMGGQSYSTVAMMEDEGYALFTGEVKDVPFLGVPGFIQMESRAGFYPDVSCCDALKLTLMTTEEYAGYRVSFGTKRAKTGFFAQGFKADFDAPRGEYGEVIVPFDRFSVEWDEATGDQIVTCAEDPTVCPDRETLVNMQTLVLWGEGVGGAVGLHVKSISAVGCSSASSSPTVRGDISSASKGTATMMVMIVGIIALSSTWSTLY